MGEDLRVPKGIWSPSGGFYADPKNWKRNTAFVAAGVAVLAYSIFRASAAREERWGVPAHRIPSQSWTPEKNFKDL